MREGVGCAGLVERALRRGVLLESGFEADLEARLRFVVEVVEGFFFCLLSIVWVSPSSCSVSASCFFVSLAGAGDTFGCCFLGGIFVISWYFDG